MRVAAALAVALAVAFVVWLLLRDGGEPEQQRAPATAMTLTQLRDFAESAEHPVFWVGPRPPGASRRDLTYEVTQTSDGAVYVRYLPAGVEVGVDRPQFLTVATYLDARASHSIRTAAKRPGAIRVPGPDGRLAVASRDRPQSVFTASPSGEEQIEVFHPNPARARRVATALREVRETGPLRPEPGLIASGAP